MTKRTSYARTADTDRPVLGRRITWEQFWAMRPDRRPANDNVKVRKQAA